ncbi:MAG TPA: hypothetical protein DDW50_09440, partial [Firmicutes bacterium]|nr:hypothetical protein [Bacillota bacterium]
MITIACLSMTAAVSPRRIQPTLRQLPIINLSPARVVEQPHADEVKPVQWPKPQLIKGIYTTGWIAGSSKWFPQLVDFIDATELNALVIDVKDDTGTLSYASKVPL